MSNQIVKVNPSILEASEVLEGGIKSKALVVMTVCCRVSYNGRAKSVLDFGDRVLLLKSDGSFMVHQNEKREPVNWQPPGSKVNCKIVNDNLVISSVRRKPVEVLMVEVSEVHMINCFMPEDKHSLDLTGSESQIADYIFNINPNIIEVGFTPIAREKRLSCGVIDILGKDKHGNLMVLELKRRKVGLDAVSQLKRYVDALKDDYKFVRGVLVAPSVTSNALDFLAECDLEFKMLELFP